MPQDLRGELIQRILGEGVLDGADRQPWARSRPGRQCALLPARKSAPRRRQRTRHLRAATESAAPQRGLTGAPRRSRRLGDGRYGTARRPHTAHRDDTLAPPLPQEAAGFPRIPTLASTSFTGATSIEHLGRVSVLLRGSDSGASVRRAMAVRGAAPALGDPAAGDSWWPRRRWRNWVSRPLGALRICYPQRYPRRGIAP
jgi:hypothetical protein